MHPRSPFADPYAAKAYAIEKLAAEHGLMAELAALPPEAKGALLGGGVGAVSGLFSDTPGSVIRRGLIGAGLGAGAGFGGRKLMDYLSSQQAGEAGAGAGDAAAAAIGHAGGKNLLPEGLADEAKTPGQHLALEDPKAKQPTWGDVSDLRPDIHIDRPHTSRIGAPVTEPADVGSPAGLPTGLGPAKIDDGGWDAPIRRKSLIGG